MTTCYYNCRVHPCFDQQPLKLLCAILHKKQKKTFFSAEFTPFRPAKAITQLQHLSVGPQMRGGIQKHPPSDPHPQSAISAFLGTRSRSCRVSDCSDASLVPVTPEGEKERPGKFASSAGSRHSFSTCKLLSLRVSPRLPDIFQ